MLLPLAVASCGNDGGRAAAPAAARSQQAPASSAPCDDAMRRSLEAQARAALERIPREEDGIIYGEVNSGCATIRVPPAEAWQP